MIHVIAAALALAPPVAADGLECVYRSADPAVLTAAGKSLQAGAADEAVYKGLNATGIACARRLGWTDTQAVDAILYAMARKGYEEAVATLRGWGVHTPLIDQIAVRLTAEQKAQMLAHNNDAVRSVGVPVILASEVAKFPRARQGEVARLVGAGLVARVTADDIAARFPR